MNQRSFPGPSKRILPASAHLGKVPEEAQDTIISRASAPLSPRFLHGGVAVYLRKRGLPHDRLPVFLILPAFAISCELMKPGFRLDTIAMHREVQLAAFG